MEEGGLGMSASALPRWSPARMSTEAQAHYANLKAYCRSLTRDAAAADDLVQTTFLRAMEKAHLFEPGTELRAWLLTIARNHFLSGEKRRLRREVEDVDGAFTGSLATDASQDAIMDLADAEYAMAALSPDAQEILRLVAMEGRSYDEAADIAGVEVGTVKSRIHRARAALNGEMKRLRGRRRSAQRRFTEKPAIAPIAVRGLTPDHAAMRENRTLFPTRVVDVTEGAPDRLLVSGHNNRKLGDVVAKGRFKGYALYGLSLEERATCPTDCAVRSVCYGNAMHMARRHRIVDDEVFFRRLESEIATIIHDEGGVLVRLHVLGDFPSTDYVDDWIGLMERHENLAVYGYTARKRDDPIGVAIQHAKSLYPDRFRIRWSNTNAADGAIVIDHDPGSAKVDGALVCPVQTDATACCASCGLCWEDRANTIAFIKHGPKSAEVQAEAEMKAATIQDATATAGKPRRVRAIALPRVQQAKPGTPPEVQWATPTDLFIEGAYQRDLSSRSIKLIRKIVAEWDWAKYKPPICAKRHGVLCVVDGQHTAIAAATLQIQRIPVLVVRAEEISERAEAFVSHNRDRLAMSVFQIFYASVTAGDQIAIAILRAAEATGAIIPRSPPTRNNGKPGQIIAIRDITQYAKNDGLAMVERIFRIAVAAQCAPLDRATTRSLHLLLSEPYFAEAASWPDSRIANGLKKIPNFAATAQMRGEESGQGQVRAGAMMIVEACAIREVAA